MNFNQEINIRNLPARINQFINLNSLFYVLILNLLIKRVKIS